MSYVIMIRIFWKQYTGLLILGAFIKHPCLFWLIPIIICSKRDGHLSLRSMSKPMPAILIIVKHTMPQNTGQ